MEEVNLILPDLFSMTPLTSSKNPHYELVGDESAKWTDSYRFFDGRDREHFMKSEFELLAALAYPRASKEDLRIACDWMNVLFVFDELGDRQDGSDTEATANAFFAALKGVDCEYSDTAFYKYVSEYVVFI